ncbi:BlyB family putative holin accessory protein (plasmid) [Borrelia miyamotoi]|uniref:BlyB family putative holin accessory protein n=1 Tax=Borrelia miyamotoi TaxID=47466 RepID=A0AAX3JPE3_9SPIR|nr:BlyB family putative holin accessory protein [Borrelia miyamotoi]WAZ72465.1 BlyB family putative holin accessory protein [Borrelia miyamotoi]WAZ72665.1 BlyB family putative holin accessory protein [Borrelia miyamotoi]WAZ72706.1 BlyB family putative holin accessory protein [Borrelia miyamotoi]WAZ72747.1 BlyB family putative holin accessory protein [Borrelia miyamotoi]WAZ72789.1 BlyB family putative holin accessory protein [Borrelia miyamotoi]
MNLSNAKLGVEILTKFTEILQNKFQDKNTSHYTNIFLKVVNYVYSLYEANINRMEQKEAIKLLSEIEEILRLNIEIIQHSQDYYDNDDYLKYISQLRAKRNKIMSTYIKILKEA